MTDIFSKSQRSKIMRAVKSCDNKSTEIKLIRYFQEKGITGWRRGYKVKGRPDFVFLKRRIAIFSDGCFWHGHDCRNTAPSSNSEYWNKKLAKNIERDKEITNAFIQRGWTVIRIWECELNKKRRKDLEAKLSLLLS